jgi:hypothetical protein
MEKHGPNDDIEAMGDQGRNELLKTIATLPNEPNKIVRMDDYITFLKSCCPLYQSSWFFVKVLRPFSFTYVAFTLDVKSMLNENLGWHPRWHPLLDGQ